MCGIAGIVSTDGRRHPQPDETLRRMVSRLTHRGPDAEGYHHGTDVHLGVRRLAVMDLETGDQPLSDEGGSIVVVYNGEIYNYAALRDELRDRGHQFRTTTDTEVIVHLYEEEGLGAFARLNGMFAIALHDARRRVVILARDPHGMKPLYWTIDAHGVRFASEAKALFADRTVSRQPDLAAIVDYLTHWYVPTPRTAFEGINKLRPGHLLVVDLAAGTSERPFSSPRLPADEKVGSLLEGRDVVLAALTDAVRRQLVADVPVGIFLSGGIDSSLIAALASRHSRKRLKAFTIQFPHHRSYDEAPMARTIAQSLGLEHVVLDLPEDPTALAQETLQTFDEPFGDFSGVAMMHLCRESRRSVTVCLAGDGGDEAFAGYFHYLAPRYASHFRRLPRMMQRVIARLVQTLPGSFDMIPFEYKARRFLRGADRPPLEAQILYKTIFVGSERDRLLGPRLQGFAGRDEVEGLREVLDTVAKTSTTPLGQLLLLERATFMLEDDLVKVDRTSMAASLEVRLPMLDDAVIDAASLLPDDALLREGQTKSVLRDLAKELLPPPIASLKKRGFTPPMSHWLAGPLDGMISEYLSESCMRKAGLVRPESVSRLISEHRLKRKDYGREIWTLIALHEWWSRQGF